MADRARPDPVALYRTMRLIRRFEERAIELVRSGDIGSGIHPCIGQEAVAAGVCAALRPDDIIMSNHRGHGHLLAKGSDPGRFLAELTGRVTGVSRGRAGSFHPSDFSAGVYGASGTVGHGAAIATGIAFALAHAACRNGPQQASSAHAACRNGRQEALPAPQGGRVVVSFFGDGAVNQGALLESLNLAALWQVPAIFVCENNLYATTLPAQHAVAGSVVGRAEAFGIRAATVDGMDPDVVYDAAAESVARARAGAGPTFLEVSTYRFEGHHTFEYRTRPRYRDEEEIARWRARDPLPRQAGRIPPGRRRQVDAEIETRLDEAVRFALDSPRPDPVDAQEHLYSTGMQLRAGVAHA